MPKGGTGDALSFRFWKRRSEGACDILKRYAAALRQELVGEVTDAVRDPVGERQGCYPEDAAKDP